MNDLNDAMYRLGYDRGYHGRTFATRDEMRDERHQAGYTDGARNAALCVARGTFAAVSSDCAERTPS